jgi:FixJ family two-component response regulator
MMHTKPHTARGNTGAVVHVVDDDASMRSALTRLLQHAGYAVRSYASAGDYLVAEPDPRPGCMLLDLQLPGPSGLELQQAMRRQHDRMPIIFVSAHGDVPHTVRALKDGATDFLVKPVDAQQLLAAIESALAGAAAVTAQAPVVAAALSERERTVLRGILDGRLNKQIAADLHLSERTIKTCRADVMRKLGAHSLPELVRMATAPPP